MMKRAAEMNCDDEETLRLVQQLMISIDCMSEREEEDAAPPPGEHHTGSWTVAMISARLKQRKVSRTKADQALARDMDARAEECVVEEEEEEDLFVFNDAIEGPGQIRVFGCCLVSLSDSLSTFFSLPSGKGGWTMRRRKTRATKVGGSGFVQSKSSPTHKLSRSLRESLGVEQESLCVVCSRTRRVLRRT